MLYCPAVVLASETALQALLIMNGTPSIVPELPCDTTLYTFYHQMYEA